MRRPIVHSQGDPADRAHGLAVRLQQPLEAAGRAPVERTRATAHLTLEVLSRNARDVLILPQVGCVENSPQLARVARVNGEQVEPACRELFHSPRVRSWNSRTRAVPSCGA